MAETSAQRQLGRALQRLLQEKAKPVQLGWTEAEIGLFTQLHIHQSGLLWDIGTSDWDLRDSLMDWRRENGTPGAAANADPMTLGCALDDFLRDARSDVADTAEDLLDLRRDAVSSAEEDLIAALKRACGADPSTGVEPADESLLEDLRIWANFTPSPGATPGASATAEPEAPSPAPR